MAMHLSLRMCYFNPLTRINQFLAPPFYAPKTHKPKNWPYNTCLDKTFPSSRNTSPIIIRLPLFYSPLNSHSDGSIIIEAFRESLLLQQGLNLFISLPCFSLHPGANRAITWLSFFLQAFACCHLIPHVILHQMV